MIWLIVLIVILPFAAVLLHGAPYLPTLKDQQQAVFKIADLKKGDLFIDLGSFGFRI